MSRLVQCQRAWNQYNADDDPQKMEDLKMNKDNKIIAITDLMNASLRNIKEATCIEEFKSDKKIYTPWAIMGEYENVRGEMEFRLEYLNDKERELMEELEDVRRDIKWVTSWIDYIGNYVKSWEECMKLMEQMTFEDIDETEETDDIDPA